MKKPSPEPPHRPSFSQAFGEALSEVFGTLIVVALVGWLGWRIVTWLFSILWGAL